MVVLVHWLLPCFHEWPFRSCQNGTCFTVNIDTYVPLYPRFIGRAHIKPVALKTALVWIS